MSSKVFSIADYPEVEISKCDKMNSGCLVFRFKGKFTQEAASKSVEAWSQFESKNPTVALVHIWNCSNMSGFEMPAKNIWMDQMDRSSARIRQIIIISDSIVIRGAARLMSKLSKHTLQVFKNEEEMERTANYADLVES